MSNVPEDWWTAASNTASTGGARGASTGSRGDTSVSGDALLSALSRVSVAPSASGGASAGMRSSADMRVVTSPSTARARGAQNIPIYVHEVVEHATGFGREGERDLAAVTKAINMVKSGNASASQLLRAVVAGSLRIDAPFNTSVLAFLHTLLIMAGPHVLNTATQQNAENKLALGMRICLDVYKSFGYDAKTPAAMLNDQIVDHFRCHPEKPRWSEWLKATKDRSPLSRAVEMYCVLLARKLAYAQSYPEVEANFSLDRYYRKLHIENAVDRYRAQENAYRQTEVMSSQMQKQLALLVQIAVSTVLALHISNVPVDIVCLVLSEACNAYVFSEYIAGKLSSQQRTHPDLQDERQCLVQILHDLSSDTSQETRRSFRTFIDASVQSEIEHPSSRSRRPESRHRREIKCSFSSFYALHKALAPPVVQNQERAPGP